MTSSTLEDTRTALVREGDTRARLDSEVSALRLDRERDLRDLRAAHSAELTAAREEGVRRAEEAAAARSVEVCVYGAVSLRRTRVFTAEAWSTVHNDVHNQRQGLIGLFVAVFRLPFTLPPSVQT